MNTSTTSASTQLDSAVEALRTLLGHRASTAQVQREHHSHGESYHPPALPDAVVVSAYHGRSA